MVQASTLVLAAFAIAPVIAAPLAVPQPTEEVFTRAVNTDYLEVRAPFFRKIGRFFKKHGGGILRTVGKYALPAAKLILRDENGSLYVREIELTERDLQDLAELEARGFDLSELTERDLAELDRELATREPKFRPRKIFGTIGNIAQKASSVAGGLGQLAGTLGFREFEDADELDARDYVDIDELLEREFDLDLEELDARRLNFRKALGTARNIVRKGSRIAGTVANVAQSLGFRELEDDEFEARSFDDLD